MRVLDFLQEIPLFDDGFEAPAFARIDSVSTRLE